LLSEAINARIRLTLSSTLKRFTPTGGDDFPIRAGLTARELLAALGIPPAEVMLIFVNGVRANLDVRLSAGDRISLFPPLGGG
jgi:molybdopterin synthase sulfur carrier subunit